LPDNSLENKTGNLTPRAGKESARKQRIRDAKTPLKERLPRHDYWRALGANGAVPYIPENIWTGMFYIDL
jgi:hypothetical protein